MSNLTYFNKLLDGAVVKHIPVGQIISRVREKGRSNHNICTVYSVSNMHGLVKAEDFRNNTVYSKDTSNYTIVQPSMFAYNPSRLNIGSIAFLKTDTAGLVSPMYVVFSVDENIITCDYLNLFIKSSYCKNKINSLIEEGARFRFDFERWNLIDVPIPPIKVQTEIVRVLGTFTSITAELTAELNMRKKQYSYYRDKLLSFEDGRAEWLTLGEIGEFIRGKRFTKKDYVNKGGINVIHYGEIYTHYGTSSTITISQVKSNLAESLRYAETNDVIVASVGETIEDVGKAVAWLGKGKVAIHDDSYAIRHSLNPKYLSYCLQTEDFISEKAKHISRGKVKRLLIDGISKVRIPIPYPNDYEKSLAEQMRIVTILDKFDALTNSITEGLPREIELRQKQYEYYRDLLLSFPKPEEAAV
ncbi:restriction endonuclease subunit S [Kordiimonas sp.]|uniref:restriction endonuclease subunit S n=1 Tax=Kordiimonas sp. TaxID=1970157 RepID=UPI003A8D236B